MLYPLRFVLETEFVLAAKARTGQTPMSDDPDWDAGTDSSAAGPEGNKVRAGWVCQGPCKSHRQVTPSGSRQPGVCGRHRPRKWDARVSIDTRSLDGRD